VIVLEFLFFNPTIIIVEMISIKRSAMPNRIGTPIKDVVA